MFQRRCLISMVLTIVLGVAFLTLAHPLSAAPQALDGVTLVVNTGNDGNSRDAYLTLREAILIARGDLWQCLSDTEKSQIYSTSWGGGPGCWDLGIGGTNYSDLIVFAAGVTTVTPNSALPALYCYDKIQSQLFTTLRTVTIVGTSAGSVDGLTLECPNVLANMSIGYLGIQNFAGYGIRGDGIQGSAFYGLAINNNTAGGIYLKYNDASSHNPRDNWIGSTNYYDRNYIYANSGDGIRIEGHYAYDFNALSNHVQNNYVGLNPNGGSAGNAGHGINVVSAWQNIIGGDAANQGNVISGNSHDGISLNGTYSNWNLVYNNIVGLNPVATTKIGNGWTGVSMYGGAQSNKIGDPSKGNLISGNGAGVYIADSGTSGNLIYANAIGTNWNSASGLGNTGQGVGLYYAASNNSIGNYTSGTGNIITSNGGPGVDIGYPGTNSNWIRGNKIGTNSTGTAALPNSIGVRIINGATNNHIGGIASVDGNLISGNGGPGVGIYNTGSSGNAVSYNFIGTNVTGTLAIPNTLQGVVIQESASSNTVSSNVISGNAQDGVNINGAGTTTNTVSANYIGLNATGSVAIPNGWAGVAVKSSANNNTIGLSGGTVQYIAGNAREGIYISNVSGTLIGTSNHIGDPIGNGLSGIVLDGSTNTNVEATTVANNGGAGIAILQTSAANNRVHIDYIGDNGGLPIDLGNNGFTPNDPGDGDTGPNTLLNYPVMTTHSPSLVTGSVCANCTVLVYRATGNPTGPHGGGFYWGSVTANGSGFWQYSVPVGLQYSDFSFVACQSSCNSTGANTSEMSPRLFQVSMPLIQKNYTAPVLPTAPGPLTVTVLSTTTINVAWNDNSANEDGFHLEQSINSSAFTTLPTITDPITTGIVITTITGLSPNTTYAYRVHAFNGAGDSTYSNSASGITPSNLTIPAAPGGLVVTGIYPDETELHWTNNATNVDAFGIDLSTDNGATWWTGSHSGQPYGVVLVDYTTVWDDQRTANTLYCYRVRSQNAGGNSAWTSKVCAWTPPLPTVNAPSNLTATVVGGTAVRLNWQDNSTNEDGFRIEVSYDNGPYNAYYTPITATKTMTMYTITDANVGHNYKFHVSAFTWYNPPNYSSWSNEANVNIPADTSTGALFINNTSYSIVSLIIDGTQRLTQNASGAIPPGGSIKITLGVGSHPYSAITGYWSAGPYRNDLWYYPGGSGTLNVSVISGNLTQVPFVNPTITQLLSDPEGTGQSHRVWMAQTGTPYVNMCFDFYNTGMFKFRGTSGNWTGLSNYWLVNYPGNLYITFRPNGFPYGSLSETSITQAFPNPSFDMIQGGTTYRYYYTATNTCY